MERFHVVSGWFSTNLIRTMDLMLLNPYFHGTTRRMGAPFWYGLLYPLGSAVAMYIFLRSWFRGRRVEWKGREYWVRDPAQAR